MCKQDEGARGAEGKAARSPKRVRERFVAYEEDFIDDSDIIKARRGALRTKYSGFFVNKVCTADSSMFRHFHLASVGNAQHHAFERVVTQRLRSSQSGNDA